MNAALQDALIEVLVRRMDTAATGAPLVDWATQALVGGVEAEAIVYLAGLPGDCSIFEAGPLLDRGLAELGLKVPPPEELRRAYVGAVSRAYLAGALPLEAALEAIHAGAVSPLGHPADLAPWCYTWEGLDSADYRPLASDEMEATARSLAAEWAVYPALWSTRGAPTCHERPG